LLLATVSTSAAGKLAAGEGRCRDAGDDKGCRNHEGDDHFTHESCLHRVFEVVSFVLPCKRGITPRIAVDVHYLSDIARAMPTCA
jgi:hypothetical protein